MKKSFKKASIVFAYVGMTMQLLGCADHTDKQSEENNPKYTRNGNYYEQDAVNTLRAESKYRIVTPMMELKNAVVEILGENYWPDALLSEEEFAERTGISAYMYESFMAEYQHSKAGIDMMIIIEAKEESIADVEKYLNQYREVLLNIYENQPQNKAKVFASRIEVISNYICYVQLGADIANLERLGEDTMVEHCQQENERAIDIMEKRILSWED